MKLTTLELTMCSLFIVMMAIGANITSIIPILVIGGVPITLQTFFAILAGLVLGSRLGTISTAVYAFMGLVGLPVFAQFSGGLRSLINPTFGFILSFLLVAYIVGKMTAKKKTVMPYIVASLVGLAVNYVVGTNWMYFAYKFWADAPEGFTYGMAWLWMVPPFPKDLFLSILAGVVAHRLRVSVFSKAQFNKLRIGI